MGQPSGQLGNLPFFDQLHNITQCPLWVKTGHSAPVGPMTALRQKQTFSKAGSLPECQAHLAELAFP